MRSPYRRSPRTWHVPHASAAALFLVVISALVAGACGGDSSFDVSDVDAREVLDESAERMEALTSFAFEVQHENGTTAIVGGIQMVSATGAVQGTERMRLDIQARFATTNIQTAIVILPDEGYLQNPITGRWQREDGLDVAQFFDPASGVTGLMRATTAVEVVGGETLDGVDAYVLEATLDSGDLGVFVGSAPAGREVIARVWIGVDDLLVRQVEVEGPIAPADGDDIVRRLILRDFNAAVEITAPR
ncbi:MAG: LppX_LprAFG lipoprotein [Chloroflexi bacterium]|nr:LppX_LprAFG lipoprotein [Chloroflexota bacterium]